MITSRHVTLLVVVTALAAPAALGRATGHSGATGRPGGGVCTQCHSPETYAGARISFEQETRVRTRQCFARNEAGQVFLQNTIHTIPYGERSLRVDLVVDEPPAGTPTPGDAAGLYCPEDSTCGAPVAGFAIEVTGANAGPNAAPILEPAGAQADMKQAGAGGENAGSPTEVNHSAPRPFAGGKVSWPFVLHSPPPSANSPAQLTLYASANACNGNGDADPGDVTTVAAPAILYFEHGADTGMHTGPECNEDLSCALFGAEVGEGGLCVCADGAEADERGYCPAGCSHVAVSDEKAPAAVFALFLLGFALLRRKR